MRHASCHRESAGKTQELAVSGAVLNMSLSDLAENLDLLKTAGLIRGFLDGGSSSAAKALSLVRLSWSTRARACTKPRQ